MASPPLPDTLRRLQRKIAANWVKLFSGTTIGAGLGLVSTILMSRTVSVADVGMISVIQTYWRTLERFLSFQSFQALIKFGNEALEAGDSDGFRTTVKICLLADLAVALSGTIIGLALFALFHDQLNIPEPLLTAGLCGAGSMLSSITGAPLGILRIFDRFGRVAWRDIIVGGLRVATSLAGLLLRLDARYFVFAWIVTEGLGNLLIVAWGFGELRRHGHHGLFGQSVRASSFFAPRRIIRSMLTINVGTMIAVATEEGDMLLVNAFAGPLGAGRYRVAKTLAGLINRLVQPLQQAIYPEIARALAAGQMSVLRRLLRQTNLLGGAVGLASFLFWLLAGDRVIRLTVGGDYAVVQPTMLILAAGYGIGFCGVANNAALLSLGRFDQFLLLSVIGTVFFFLTAVPLMPSIAESGAAWGQCAAAVSSLVAGYLLIRRALRMRDRRHV